MDGDCETLLNEMSKERIKAQMETLKKISEARERGNETEVQRLEELLDMITDAYHKDLDVHFRTCPNSKIA